MSFLKILFFRELYVLNILLANENNKLVIDT